MGVRALPHVCLVTESGRANNDSHHKNSADRYRGEYFSLDGD